MDITKSWASFQNILCQVFIAATFSCYFLVDLSTFTFILNYWKAALLGKNQPIDMVSEEYSYHFAFGNSWVALVVV